MSIHDPYLNGSTKLSVAIVLRREEDPRRIQRRQGQPMLLSLVPRRQNRLLRAIFNHTV